MGPIWLLFCVVLREINLSRFTYFQIRGPANMDKQGSWRYFETKINGKRKLGGDFICNPNSAIIVVFLLMETFCNFKSVFLV